MLSIKELQKGAYVCALALLLSACNGAQYEFAQGVEVPESSQSTDGTPVVGTDPNRCGTGSVSQRVDVKVMMVVDQSGSNLADGSIPGTDPTKQFRGGSIQRFLDQYMNRRNFFWSFISFQNTTTQDWTPGFTSSPAEMQRALNNFLASEDFGGTPYNTALARAATLIEADVRPGSRTRYAVVFVSDGMPSAPYSNTGVLDGVRNVLSKAPGRVSLNTIYYGPSSTSATSLMMQMASVGEGNYLDTNISGRVFEIGDVIQIPSTCQ